MPGATSTEPTQVRDTAWGILLAAAQAAATAEQDGRERPYRFEDGVLVPAERDGADTVLRWRPGTGWQSNLGASDPRADLFELYLPICSATAARPIAVGHLGQSIDGFIATESGDSQFVTGRANVVHMHWLRGLCDAVVVGAGTVAADDPQLTTRHVAGPHPLRVVFDPSRRLHGRYRVFTDTAAPTLYVCRDEHVKRGETRLGSAEVSGLPANAPGGAPGALLCLLRQRGLSRVFVEGGGVTVSAFLDASLLDRLHIAVAPVIIGSGRPAIRLRPPAELRDCARPAYRVFRMGGDVLFDCDLRASGVQPSADPLDVTRVI